ncbi:MAG: DUF898 domain-containing protein [Treponema sp.]|nr:DUF898 domain-containing protein [Treponema sp.]
MISIIIIILLLGIIGYLVLDKKNVKMDDVKTFLKDSGTKIKEESGPLFERVKESFSSFSEEKLSVAPASGMPMPLVLEESYFDGGLLQLIVWTILGFLVTVLTFGICAPWGFTMKYSWETKHMVINGRRLQFDGTALQLFGNWIKWLILTFITFGIYGFWLPIKLKKWRAKHTSFAEYAYPAVSPAVEATDNTGEQSAVNQPNQAEETASFDDGGI